MSIFIIATEISDGGLSEGEVAAIVIFVLIIVAAAVVVGAVISILYFKGKINLKGESYGMGVGEMSSLPPHTYWKATEGRLVFIGIL